MKKISFIFSLLLILSGIAADAGAVPSVWGTSAAGELTGTRKEGLGHLVTGGKWHTDDLNLTLRWVITDLGGGLWDYKYTFSKFSNPGISHFDLNLSIGCGSDPGCVQGVTGDYEIGTFGPGPSAPGFPESASIYGVKLDFGGEAPYTFEFQSNRAPVYGDFYMKGGKSSFAYNAGLSDEDSACAFDFVARPDGNTSVPEPASIILLVGGIAGLAAARKKIVR